MGIDILLVEVEPGCADASASCPRCANRITAPIDRKTVCPTCGTECMLKEGREEDPPSPASNLPGHVL